MRHQRSIETRHHHGSWLRGKHIQGQAQNGGMYRGDGTGGAWGKPLCYPRGLHHHFTESHNPTWKPEDRAVLCRHPEAHCVSTHSVSQGPGLEGKTGVGFRPDAAGPHSRQTPTARGPGATLGFKARPLHAAVGACWEQPGFPQWWRGSSSRPGPRTDTGRGRRQAPSPADGCEPRRCHHQ